MSVGVEVQYHDLCQVVFLELEALLDRQGCPVDVTSIIQLRFTVEKRLGDLPDARVTSGSPENGLQ